jgi:hypothetical protein
MRSQENIHIQTKKTLLNGENLKLINFQLSWVIKRHQQQHAFIEPKQQYG